MQIRFEKTIRVARKMAMMAIVLTAISFVLNIVIDNPYTHSLARKLVNERLKNYVDIKLDFRAIKITAVPLGIDLYGFRVSSATRPDKDLLKASQLKARISFSSIIFGNPRIGLVEASELEASWPLDPALQAALGLDQPSEDTESKFTWPLPIAELPVEVIQLKQARLYFEVPNTKPNLPPVVAASISQLDFRANVSDIRNISISAQSGGVELSADKFKIFENAKIDLRLVLGPEKLRNSSFFIQTGPTEVRGNIEGRFAKDERDNSVQAIFLNSKFNLDGDMATVGRILDIADNDGKAKIQGHAELMIPVAVTVQPKFGVSLDAEFSNARLAGFKLRDSTAKLAVTPDDLKIVQGTYIADGKTYGSFNGQLGFASNIPLDFSASLQGLPLRTLMDSLKVEDFDIIAADLHTKELKIKGQGSPFRMDVTSTAEFANFGFGFAQEMVVQSKAIKPICLSYLNLGINDAGLNFRNTRLDCYQPDRAGAPGALPQVDNIQPQFNSTLMLGGVATFDEKTGLNINVNSDALDLHLANGMVGQDLSGTANINVNVFGPYSDIKVSTQVDARSLAFRKALLGRVQSKFQLTQGNRLSWSNLSIQPTRDGVIAANKGSLILNDSLEIDTDLKLHNITAISMRPLLLSVGVDDVSLDIDQVEGRITGPLLSPMRYQGELDASLSQLRIGKDQLFDTASFKLVAVRDTAELRDVKVVLKDLELTANASVNLKRQFSQKLLGLSEYDLIKLQAKARTIGGDSRGTFDHLQLFPVVRDYATMARIAGQVTGTVDVEGTLNNLKTKANVTLIHARLLGAQVPDLHVAADYDKDRLSTRISQRGDNLLADIDIDLTKPSLPYQWKIRANKFDIRSLGGPVFAADPRNYAYFSGEWQMAGTFSDWWNSQGQLLIQDIRGMYNPQSRNQIPNVEFALKRPTTIDISQRRWQIANGEKLSIGNQYVQLDIATEQNRLPDNIDIKLGGALGVESLQNFIPDLETAAGRLAFQGYLQGSIEDPKYMLAIKSDSEYPTPVAFGLASTRPAFNNVNLDIRLVNDSIVVNSFSAEKGKGRVNASGQLILGSNQLQASHIDISLVNATFFSQVSVLKTFESELSGSISISGNELPLLIAGDIEISRARSVRNFDLREEIVNALKRRNLESSVVDSQAKPSVQFDLRINAAESIVISNRNIQTVLSTNLTLSGTDIAPVVSGQVEIDKGSFAYKYQRDFRVNQGVITFDDPIRPDPRLDILAVSEMNGYRVFMAITGRGSDPKIDLSIDPPIREDGTPLTKVDILVLLSTGSLPQQRERSGTATEDAFKAEAINLLVGQFEEPVERLFEMSGQTVVQQVYLDSYAGNDGRPTARLNLPLNIHEDWDVVFRVDDTTQKLSLGYRIDDHLSLSGSLDRQSKDSSNTKTSATDPTDTGVDLKFRFSFP